MERRFPEEVSRRDFDPLEMTMVWRRHRGRPWNNLTGGEEKRRLRAEKRKEKEEEKVRIGRIERDIQLRSAESMMKLEETYPVGTGEDLLKSMDDIGE